MAELNLDDRPEPTDFEVLKKWCAWVTSPADNDQGYVVNATTFSMLVDFTLDGVSLFRRTISVTYEVVGGDQELWNTKMAALESLTADDVAAIPKVIAAIKAAAKIARDA